MGHPSPSQVPLPLSVRTTNGNVSTLSERYGRSDRASQRQQVSDELIHLLSIASLTGISLLVEAVMRCLSAIFHLRAAKRAEI